MSFILVDGISHFQSGISARGVKHITASEPYLTRSYSSGELIYLPSLIGESVGQLAAWAVIDALKFQKRPVAGIVSQVNILGEVRVGQTLQLTAEIDALDDEAVEYHGAAYVGDKKVFEIESAIGPMMAMSDMNPTSEVKRQLSQLLETNVDLTDIADCFADNSIAAQALINLGPSPHAGFDDLLAFEQGKKCIALKRVSRSAPFLADHFTLNPVLPLTILLESKISLAQRYVQQFYADKPYQVVAVRKVKMSQFVRPGNIVRTEMMVKEKQDQLFCQFKSYVGSQRVCVCEVLMSPLGENCDE